MKKNLLFAGMLVVGLAVILGLNYYLDKKNEAKSIIQETTFSQTEKEKDRDSELEKEETAIPEETKAEETIIYTHPEDYPEEEPLPEVYGGDVEGIEIHVYLTNMDSIDSSGLLPYNAWENMMKKLQMFLNFEGLEVSEVQAIENSIEQEGDIITFYAVFPQYPGETLRLKYDIKLREWNFIIDNGEDIENEIKENSIDGGFK